MMTILTAALFLLAQTPAAPPGPHTPEAAVVRGESFLGVPPTVWQMLIAAVVTIILAKMQHQTAAKVQEVARKADVAAVKVETVKQDLKDSNRDTAGKLDELASVANETKKTGDAVHTLVNSSFSAQLKVAMIALKRVAELTGHKDDIEAAAMAEDLYHKHEEKQGMVDRGESLSTNPGRPSTSS